MNIKGLDSGEKRVFTIHMAYSLIEGIILGVFVLNEFVFVKSLGSSEELLAVLFQTTSIILIIAALVNEIQRRYERKKVLKYLAFATRLPLIALAFFPDNIREMPEGNIWHILFLIIFFMYYMANPMIYPTINYYLKNSYQKMHFGKLYSYATSANKVVMLVSTLVFGIMLDYDNYIYIYVYPVVAVLGIISIFLLTLIDKSVKAEVRDFKPFFVSVKDSIRKMFRVIKFNKPFRDFEIGFMLYGFAFMITISIITNYMADELNLNYTSLSIYKNFYNILAIILLPFFGRLMDKIDPRKFAMITFLSLLLYIMFIGLTEYFPYNFELGLPYLKENFQVYYTLVISFIFHGFFAATMSLLWSIGSAYFCKNEDTGDYQSVHLTLVGGRALFAPLLGVLFYKLYGFVFVVLLGILFLSLAILTMWLSMRKYKHATAE